jgi:hypothetical protein
VIKLSMLRPRTQLALTVLIPAACLALAVLLVWPYVANLHRVRRELEQTQDTIQQKKSMIAQAEAAAQGRPLALAVALPDEQEPIVFLKQLAALTTDSGVALTAVRALAPVQTPNASYSAAAAPASGSVQTSSQDGTTPAPGPGQRPVVSAAVKELQDQVTVEGPFTSLLALLVRLENYDRILSVSQCKIRSSSTHGYPELRAVFTLSRFVAAPEPVKASLSAPPAIAR